MENTYPRKQTKSIFKTFKSKAFRFPKLKIKSQKVQEQSFKNEHIVHKKRKVWEKSRLVKRFINKDKKREEELALIKNPSLRQRYSSNESIIVIYKKRDEKIKYSNPCRNSYTGKPIVRDLNLTFEDSFTFSRNSVRQKKRYQNNKDIVRKRPKSLFSNYLPEISIDEYSNNGLIDDTYLNKSASCDVLFGVSNIRSEDTDDETFLEDPFIKSTQEVFCDDLFPCTSRLTLHEASGSTSSGSIVKSDNNLVDEELTDSVEDEVDNYIISDYESSLQSSKLFLQP